MATPERSDTLALPGGIRKPESRVWCPSCWRSSASTGQSEPRHFDSVTVLFTDCVGFTKTAETMLPRQLIATLDRYFLRASR